jgi:hypothetical protein
MLATVGETSTGAVRLAVVEAVMVAELVLVPPAL